jgi:hypothetical protein
MLRGARLAWGRGQHAGPSAAAAALAAASAGLAMAAGTVTADTPAAPNAGAPPEQLQDWLKQQGADVTRVAVRQSQAGPGAGLGLFATVSASAGRPGSAWWSFLWPWGRKSRATHEDQVSLASFPLSAAVTAETACNDSQVGSTFRWACTLHSQTAPPPQQAANWRAGLPAHGTVAHGLPSAAAVLVPRPTAGCSISRCWTSGPR